MSGIAITAEGLTKVYKNIPAVNNLSLHIPEGTIYGFLGPNGAGKTTTIRMLLGLIRPTSGKATIFGHDILHARKHIAPYVGAIVESPAFYTYMSGLENLRILARSGGQDLPQSRYDQLIEFVGLRGREKDKVKTYSLGMKQRLGVAATLLNDPKIVFLDEPTNGLDPAGTVEMRNLILRMGQEGRTVFLSSHLLFEVEQVCSNVAIIQKGVTIKQGRVRDLLATEGGPGYAIEAAPFERAMAILQELPELKAHSFDQHWININAEPQDVPNVMRKLVQADVDVFQVVVRQRSLESLFLEITGTGGAAVQQPLAEVVVGGR